MRAFLTLATLASAMFLGASDLRAAQVYPAANAVVNAQVAADQWRYRYHNNQWWYYTPGNYWMTHSNGAWSRYNAPAVNAGVNTYYRGNYGNPYYGNSGYYGNYYGNPYNRGYYNGGYYNGGYNRGYYNNGYYNSNPGVRINTPIGRVNVGGGLFR